MRLQAVINQTLISCKCHGVSGSCALKTCWHQLREFRSVGDRLRWRYDRAAWEATFNRHGTHLVVVPPSTTTSTMTDAKHRRRQQPLERRVSSHHLVYVDASPDYCVEDLASGWPGTHGRRCVRRRPSTSASTLDAGSGCETLCCGRGYDAYRQAVKQRCRCRFHWCCSVECDVCQHIEDVHVCK